MSFARRICNVWYLYWSFAEVNMRITLWKPENDLDICLQVVPAILRIRLKYESVEKWDDCSPARTLRQKWQEC